MITYRQPFRGEYPITQQFGEVIQGVTFGDKPHTGIDYGCPMGTEILASCDGIVMASSYDGSGYGNRVILQHESRKATLYAHLSKSIVVPAQEVKQGEVIGYSGNTGYTTGPHLHFEARRIWWDQSTAKDPITFLPLMSVDDGAGIQQAENQTTQAGNRPLTAGVYRVACEAAYVRGWEKLNREKLVYKGEPVYLFGQVKYQDGLPFYFCGAGSCMAAYDINGTTILEKVEDGEEE